jgi:hypothetical protein
MLPLDKILKHQYHAKNYQYYSELVQDLLQIEKHDELTMSNHHQHSIGTASLQEVNYNSKGKEKVDGQNNHPKNSSKSKKGKKSTRRTSLKTKVREKVRNISSATIVMVLIILQRSAIYSNTWLTYTRNPLKRLKKAKDYMKLTSMLHLIRLQLRASTLMTL